MPPLTIPAASQLAQSSKYLPLLLKATGDLPSAENELRWLREHVNKVLPSTAPRHQRKRELLTLCKRRAKLEPLQYILGSQPFGELEILCRPGVLIPRPETESYTLHLAKLINADKLSTPMTTKFAPPKKEQEKPMKPIPPLKILDICSGSGCISLLLHGQLTKKFPNLSIRGWDISQGACKSAQTSLALNIEKGNLSLIARPQIQFHRGNLFNPTETLLKEFNEADIIISNPPYISAKKLITETTESVREWEPNRALVPPEGQTLYQDPGHTARKIDLSRARTEDIFYAQLLYFHARRWSCHALIMEIGDQEQAIRVVRKALSWPHIKKYNRIEIWRDFPDQEPRADEKQYVRIGRDKILVKGAGNMRTVVVVLETEPPEQRPDDWYLHEMKRRKIRKTAAQLPPEPIEKLIRRQLKSARDKQTGQLLLPAE